MPATGTGSGAPARGAPWTEDVLGPGWSALTLSVGPAPDDVATLVRRDITRRATKGAVLYLHGFVDYFFAAHLGRAWADRGFAFYALDLRRHGRSLRPGQLANHTTDLREYYTELDLAAEIIADAGHGPLIVLGHSTGGLVASLWANERRDETGPDLVILNSPWLELNGPWYERKLLTPVVRGLGRIAPTVKVGSLSPYYGEFLHRDTGGEWDYDLAWKPHQGFPARAGFIRTVRRAHAEVARGLDIPCPVLVCCSSASGPHDEFHTALDRTDSVLDVNHIVALAPRLGRDVTVVQIDRGVHDLALSPHVVRTDYFTRSTRWAEERLADLPEV